MIILDSNKYIKKIYHISDIHIRRYDRHLEYEIVFNNLYTYLNNVKHNNSLNNQLIVITGDLLHAKDNLTPDCVVKCYKFLKTLADIMPVILIAGNHDMVESNKTIKDSIDAILSEVESDLENNRMGEVKAKIKKDKHKIPAQYYNTIMKSIK